MPYIARIEDGRVAEMKVGSLTDVADSDRANWRAVIEGGDRQGDSITTVRYISEVKLVEPIVELVWATTKLPELVGNAKLKDYAATVRWQHVVRGIVLPNGMRIDSSEATKSKITQALLILERGWSSSINWKGRSGWMTVDAEQMKGIAQALAAHEQACFDAEKAVHEAIDAGVITSKTGVDEYPWP